jgi:hypothetical protein
MIGKTMHKAKYIYYKCVTDAYPKERKTCNEIQVRQDMVDGMVWDWLFSLMEDERRLKKGLYSMRNKRNMDLEPQRQRLDIINSKIDGAKRKIESLFWAFGEDDNKDLKDALQKEVDRQKTTGRAYHPARFGYW